MWRQRWRCTLCAMTETPPPPQDATTGSTGTAATAQAPPPPLPPAPAPLYRPREGRVFRGVCAAIGRATGTDPVLWRVLVVVFLFFGGAGLVLYLVGWLFLPDEGEPATDLQRLFRGQGASTSGAIALAVLVVIATLVVFDDGRGLLPLIVVAGLAYLVLRDRQSTTIGPAAAPGWGPGAPPGGWAPPPAWTAPAGSAPGGWGPPPGPAWPPPPAPPPAPPRPRSPLGLLTVSAVVLVVGALLLAGNLGLEGITATRVLASALLVTGLGLLVGTVWGRARGLIALALVLASTMSATSSFDGRFGTATGERTWVVNGSAEHELGGGTATLDLRPLAGRRTSGVTVEASVGAGELVVLVPEDLRVAIDSNVGLGEYVLTEDGATQVAGGGAGLERGVLLGPPGTPAVRVRATVGLGSLEVRRVAAR